MEQIISLKNLFKNKWLYTAGYIYLVISLIIFIIGNLQWYFSAPLTMILIYATYKAIKNVPDTNTNMFREKKKLIPIIIFILLVWVIISGIGGYMWQNPDHEYRNAIFNDLVNYKWPVMNDEMGLCYYYGFWMLPAVMGKIFGLQFGYFFQVIWATIGLVITFGLISEFVKKFCISNLFIFIFFSGLDYVSQALNFKNLFFPIGTHLEWIGIFQSSSNTTLLFWVFNQALPFWIGMMLLLLQTNNKSIAFIFMTLLLSSPFPAAGLFPIGVYMVFKSYNNESYKEYIKNAKNKFHIFLLKLKRFCTFENITALVIAFILLLFYASNISVGSVQSSGGGISMKWFIPLDYAPFFISFSNLSLIILAKFLLSYLVYIMFDFFIYVAFIWESNKKDTILKIILISILIFPLIRVGYGYDFGMRTCIPFAFYIMLLIMKEFQNKGMTKLKRTLLIVTLCIGAITPFMEFSRTFISQYNAIKDNTSVRADEVKSVFNIPGDNFIASPDSPFYKYFAKKNVPAQ